METEKDPALQLVQELAPAGDQEPTAQVLHVPAKVAPEDNDQVPALQKRHCVTAIAPVTEDQLPGLHAMQLLDDAEPVELE